MGLTLARWEARTVLLIIQEEPAIFNSYAEIERNFILSIFSFYVVEQQFNENAVNFGMWIHYFLRKIPLTLIIL